MPRTAGHLLGYVAIALGLQTPASCKIYISFVLKCVERCVAPCKLIGPGYADWLQVWGGATDAAAGAETGAVARMHSALIAVVAHLLTRLGAQALSEAQVGWLHARALLSIPHLPVSRGTD